MQTVRHHSPPTPSLGNIHVHTNSIRHKKRKKRKKKHDKGSVPNEIKMFVIKTLHKEGLTVYI